MRVEGACVHKDLFRRAKNSWRQVNQTDSKILSKQTNRGKEIASDANNNTRCCGDKPTLSSRRKQSITEGTQTHLPS